MLTGPFHFVFNGSSIDLNFHDVGFLLALLEQLHLGVSNDPNDTAVTDHLLEVLLNGLATQLILPLLASLSEGLLLALVPN